MAYDDFDESDFEEEDKLHQTYLTFAVGEEEYAISVAHVIEIVRLQKVFAVPDVANHIRGVINLRGKVIPLLDVRARFGLSETVYSDRTVIVVIEVDGAPTGLVVDAIHDIAEFPPDTIEPATAQLSRGSAEPLVTGLCKREDQVSLLIAADRLVGVSAPATDASAPVRT
jgi:purine-binding chemotaxis protein CheW